MQSFSKPLYLLKKFKPHDEQELPYFFKAMARNFLLRANAVITVSLG
jgi:hypothetical protein